MHAVFFMCEVIRVDGLEDQTIYIFEDEQTANDFVFEKMVEAGLICVENGEIFVEGHRQPLETKEIAIEEAQGMLSSLEFFHVYKAVDHRAVITIVNSTRRQP